MLGDDGHENKNEHGFETKSVATGSMKTAEASVAFMAMKAANYRTVFDDAEEQCDIQRAVVRLLGRLGGRNQLMLIDPTEAVKDSLSWGDTDTLMIKLPFPVVTVDKGMATVSSNAATAQVSGNKRAAGGVGKATTDTIGGSATAKATGGAFELTVALDLLLPRITELCGARDDANSANKAYSIASAGMVGQNDSLLFKCPNAQIRDLFFSNHRISYNILC
jgi:hypothetical protein